MTSARPGWTDEGSGDQEKWQSQKKDRRYQGIVARSAKSMKSKEDPTRPGESNKARRQQSGQDSSTRSREYDIVRRER